MEKDRDAVKIPYLNLIADGHWDWDTLTEEERAEWDLIVSDFRNGEDRKLHQAKVAYFKVRMDEKYAKK
jgi:hypothetical protein